MNISATMPSTSAHRPNFSDETTVFNSGREKIGIVSVDSPAEPSARFHDQKKKGFPTNVRIPVVSVPCHQHCHSPVSNSDCAHEAGLSPGILSKFVQCVDSVSVAKIGEFSSAILLKLFSFPRLCLQFSVVGSTAVFQGAATAVWFHFVFVVVGHRTVFSLALSPSPSHRGSSGFYCAVRQSRPDCTMMDCHHLIPMVSTVSLFVFGVFCLSPLPLTWTQRRLHDGRILNPNHLLYDRRNSTGEMNTELQRFNALHFKVLRQIFGVSPGFCALFR